jgi:hypothetical protein
MPALPALKCAPDEMECFYSSNDNEGKEFRVVVRGSREEFMEKLCKEKL